MNINVHRKQITREWELFEISLEDNLKPYDLAIFNEFGFREVEYDHVKGALITGRAPIWLYGLLIAEFSLSPFIATFDPKLNGYIVCYSTTKAFPVGKVINESDDLIL